MDTEYPHACCLHVSFSGRQDEAEGCRNGIDPDPLSSVDPSIIAPDCQVCRHAVMPAARRAAMRGGNTLPSLSLPPPHAGLPGVPPCAFVSAAPRRSGSPRALGWRTRGRPAACRKGGPAWPDTWLMGRCVEWGVQELERQVLYTDEWDGLLSRRSIKVPRHSALPPHARDTALRVFIFG